MTITDGTGKSLVDRFGGGSPVVVALSLKSAQIVEAQVRDGHYPSAEEAVAAALLRLESEPMRADEVEELRAAVDVGLAEADRGEFVEFTAEDVIAERRDNLARRQGRA